MAKAIAVNGDVNVEEIVKALGSAKALAVEFPDVIGATQRITVRWKDEAGRKEAVEELFLEGAPKLDGSSIKGFKGINNSDLLLLADPATVRMLPRSGGTTARAYSFVLEPQAGGKATPFSRDSRWIARKADQYLKEQMGVTEARFGPELEFFIADKVEFDLSTPITGIGYKITSAEVPQSGNAASIPPKSGYYPGPPQDQQIGIRDEISDALMELGLTVDAHHHEVATGGQGEINVRYLRSAVEGGDMVLAFRQTAKIIAAEHGKVAMFAPKPVGGDNGSGMHTNVSLWRGKKNLFFDKDDKYGLSQMGRYAIGGLKEHAPALTAFVNPHVNSFSRLVPHFEAPTRISWGVGNRSAIIRRPSYKLWSEGPARIEYRQPDPSCNAHLGFAAILMAVYDGIQKKMDPGPPVPDVVYEMDAAQMKKYGVKDLPGSVREANEELANDSAFLTRGSVISKDMIQAHTDLAMAEETLVAQSPHPLAVYLANLV